MVGATIGAALHPRACLRRGEYVVKSALGLLLLRFSVTPPHADQRSHDPLITCPKARCRPAACLSGALQVTRLTQVLTPHGGAGLLSRWLIQVVPYVTTTPPATAKMPVVTAVHDRLSCRTPP